MILSLYESEPEARSFAPQRSVAPEARDALARLAADLAQPPLHCDWNELPRLWSFDQYLLICKKPDALEEYPELSVRLRGALGRALFDLPSRRSRSGRTLPHAYDVLFAPLASRQGGQEIPRPIVVRGRVEGATLIVELRIFGDAMPWAEDAALAMTMALEGGVAVSSTTRVRAAIAVENIVKRRVQAADPASYASYASLTFSSPVTVRLGERLSEDPRAILRACVRRIETMARWHGVDMGPPDRQIAEEVANLRCDADDLRRYAWTRNSRRQGDTRIPMAGWLGRLVVRGRMERLLPALSLSETCNAGSHAGLGLGWFDLAIL